MDHNRTALILQDFVYNINVVLVNVLFENREVTIVMFARISKDIITSYYRPKVEMEVHMRPCHWNKILRLD